MVGVDGFGWWKDDNYDPLYLSNIARRIILYSGPVGGTSLRPTAAPENEGFLFCDTLAPGGNISRSDGTNWVDVTQDLPM